MRQLWVWLLVAVGAAAAWLGFVIQLVGGKPLGTHPVVFQYSAERSRRFSIVMAENPAEPLTASDAA